MMEYGTWAQASGIPHYCNAPISEIGLFRENGRLSAISGNHLEERLLDQAQARASYTPLLGGHSHSIPQGMIFDVQPLVKSLFCPIRQSPIGFFDFEASIPENWISLFRGGGAGGVGWGSKVFTQKAPSSGEAHCCHTSVEWYRS